MLVEVLEPSVLRMPELSDDAFFDFCASNDEYRIERTAEGRIVIMSGTGARTSARNNRLSARLLDWSDQRGKGEAFDSDTIFRLPRYIHMYICMYICILYMYMCIRSDLSQMLWQGFSTNAALVDIEQ